MMEIFTAVFIGMIFGYLLRKEKEPPIVEILQNQVEQYEKDLVYYKDLCKWHVEEKAKLQSVREQFERECG